METKNIILKLRTERGMSQDELADKIMVTRQAVSRWENGDTVPNTDTPVSYTHLAQVTVCDCMENFSGVENADMTRAQDGWSFTMKPYEIKTLRIVNEKK